MEGRGKRGFETVALKGPQADATIRSPVRGVRLGRRRLKLEGVLPKCQACKQGDLVPLSDFGGQGASIHYKAWVCTNPQCGFNVKIRNGDVYLNEPISNGADHTPRYR